MKTMHFAFLLLCVPMTFIALASCGSDETKTEGTGGAGNAGGSNATGGTGGANIAGQGGTAGSSAQGGNAGSENSWAKGVVGRATKGTITLAEHAGRIQGFSVTPGMAVRIMAGDAGSNEDASTDDGGTTPQTAPVADFSGIETDFTEMYIPVLPYTSDDGTIKYPPLTAVYKPDGTMETIQHFANWDTNNELAMGCFGAYPVSVNNQQLRTFGGLSMDITDCLNRHFMVSNASDKIWELLPNGEKAVIAENFGTALSSIVCHPMGYLLATTLPTYNTSAPITVSTGVELYKVTLDGAKSLIAAMPVPDDYATNDLFSLCGQYPFTSKSLPSGMKVPIALRANGSFMLADVGAKKIYTISEDGTQISMFSQMDKMTMWAILAPNDVIYTIEPPVLDELSQIVYVGTKIKGFDGTNWVDVIELEGYDSYINSMSWQNIALPCPQDETQRCYQPYGVFLKVMYGANGTLYIVDPIKGTLSALPLDMTDPDAGTGEAGVDAEADAGASGNGG